jgi:hypothetical protein
MGKFSSLNADIYSVFAQSAWIAENIKTFPENYVGTSVGNEYIRVSIVASSYDKLGSFQSVNGQLIIDIFTPAGEGVSRTNTIADKLDDYLIGKQILVPPDGNTQFGNSTLTFLGNDKANPSLYRASYSLSFNHYGI